MTTVAKFDWLRLIREENWAESNSQAKGTPPQLTNADLRMADLRRASLHEARISGDPSLGPARHRMRTRAADRVPSQATGRITPGHRRRARIPRRSCRM